MFQLQLNLTFLKYVELINPYENYLDQTKQLLLDKEIKIQHPSTTEALTTLQKQFLNFKYPKEIRNFGSVEKFYSALILLNYHKGNIIVLAERFGHHELQNMTFTLSIEELLILDTFKNVI